MRIKETPWEKENLGVESSAVFYIEECDTGAILEEKVVDNSEYIYQEAVVPTTRIDLLNLLLRNGFRFAEVAMQQSVKLPSSLPKAFERHARNFSFRLANEDEINQVYHSIVNGYVFQTDKISLNPRFGPKVAARRYINWVRKEISEKKAFLYMIQCKNENIGFTILKIDEKRVCNGLLTGLLNLESYSGFGIYLGYCTILAAGSMGAKCLKAHVSSNNIPVIKVNQLLGYQIEDMNYILTRYIEN